MEREGLEEGKGMSERMVCIREFRDLKAAGKPIRRVGDVFMASPERAVELRGFAVSDGEYVPIASADNVGVIMVDGETIQVEDGVAFVPTASSTALGVVMVDDQTIVADSGGVISAVVDTQPQQDDTGEK